MSDPFAYNVNDAFYGPLGEYVRRTEETVEVDALTHLSQVITAAGTAIGRRVATQGGHSLHYANLYTLVIGDSGVGKGVSWELAAKLGQAIAPGFTKRTAYDVASTPGLITLIADEVLAPSRKRPKEGEQQEYKTVVAPVHDKRLLLQISEMMSVFTSKERDGSTLGEALRNAWDGRDLENNAKVRLTATNPHIALVGHITPVDFAKALADNRRDLRNGFFNRFIILRAHNERVLPFYAAPPDCGDLFSRMRESLDRLGPVAQPRPSIVLDWHASARDLWSAFYTACKHGTHPFLRGMDGMHSRLAPVAMRVALNHAVFDNAEAIYDSHLRAGIAHALATVDSRRDLFTHTQPSKPSLAAVLRASFAGRYDEWNSTALHEATGKQFCADDLKKSADELVQAGEWLSRDGKQGNGHIGTLFRLAISPEANTPHTAEDPARSERNASELSINGMRFSKGAAFRVRHDADAITLDDKPTALRAGQEGFIVAVADNASAEERDRAHALASKKSAHSLAAIGGELLFVKPKSLDIVEMAAAC
jgi:hypothetical protein